MSSFVSISFLLTWSSLNFFLSCVQSQTFDRRINGDLQALTGVEINPVSHTCGHPDSGMTSYTSYVWQFLQEGVADEERPCDYYCKRTFDENFSRVNRFKIENLNQIGQYNSQECNGYVTSDVTDERGSGSFDSSTTRSTPATSTTRRTPATMEYVTTINVDNQCAIKDLRFAERSLFFHGNMTHSMRVKVDDDSHNDS